MDPASLIINLLGPTSIAAAMARFIQAQYEKRIAGNAELYAQQLSQQSAGFAQERAAYERQIATLEERVAAQSGKLDSLIESHRNLSEAARSAADTARINAEVAKLAKAEERRRRED